ncbi:MAG: PKD domain-containing protein [Mycobacteriales bacterium]
MRRSRLLLPLLLLAVPLAVPASAKPAAAEVRVGTAVVDVTPAPDDPQYLGGFGKMDAPTAKALDPLEIRAFVVRRGSSVAAFAVVDVQGWFAGYQQGPYGITDVREQVGSWLAKHGSPAAGPQNVIVSSTHSHAAPTIMGIWGPTDLRWLKRVHAGTIAALTKAAATARPAELWTADAEVGEADGSTVAQTDIYDGWTVDEKLPLLWARDPRTHKTIGLYGNVPVHADIVSGKDENAMSADHIGIEREALDDLLGGTSVLAMGTLGRQESIVQVGGRVESRRVAAFITARIRVALAKATRLRNPVVGGYEQHVLVPGTNPALLALIALNPAGAPCLPGADICPIDRSIEPPYLYGNVVGTWVTSLRIGDLLYVSQPGEAFPEVSQAIRGSVPDARVRVVGMAQDQLGYYYPAEDTPFTTVPNVSDHLQYLTGETLADQNVLAAVDGAKALGLDASFVHPTPGIVDPAARRMPGVQAFGAPADTASLTTLLDVSYNRAVDESALVDEGTAPVRWTFGDGTSARSKGAIRHTWKRPGRYTVTLTVEDVVGRTRTASLVVNVGRPAAPLPR